MTSFPKRVSIGKGIGGPLSREAQKAPLPKCDDPKLQSITIRPYLTTNGEGKTVGAMPE